MSVHAQLEEIVKSQLDIIQGVALGDLLTRDQRDCLKLALDVQKYLDGKDTSEPEDVIDSNILDLVKKVYAESKG